MVDNQLRQSHKVHVCYIGLFFLLWEKGKASEPKLHNSTTFAFIFEGQVRKKGYNVEA
jgi:hypothetical protein